MSPDEPAPKKAARTPKSAPSEPAPEPSPAAPTTPEAPAAAPVAAAEPPKPTPKAAAKPGAEGPSAKPAPKSRAKGRTAPGPRPAAAKAPGPAKSAPAPSPARRASPPPTPRFPASAVVVDATGLVLGRAASLIAKRLLNGETIVVIHAEQSLLTGRRAMVVAQYTDARARGSVRSGPHFPRFPDRIFRRTVRGMLPHLKTRGKEAFARLHVYIGVPDGLGSRTPITLEAAKARPALRTPTTLREITVLLGAHL